MKGLEVTSDPGECPGVVDVPYCTTLDASVSAGGFRKAESELSAYKVRVWVSYLRSAIYWCVLLVCVERKKLLKLGSNCELFRGLYSNLYPC